MTVRERSPNRRYSETFSFECGSLRYPVHNVKPRRERGSPMRERGSEQRHDAHPQ
jgi:hypothetical protein